MKPVTVKTIHRVMQDLYPDVHLYIARTDNHGTKNIRSVISNTKVKAGLRTKVIEYRSNRLELTIPEYTEYAVIISNQSIDVALKDSTVKLIHTRFVVANLKVKTQLILLGIRYVRVFSTDLTDTTVIPVDKLDDRTHLKYCYVVDPSLEIDIDLVTQAFKLKGIM